MNVLITGATAKVAEAITRVLYAETDWNIFLVSNKAKYKDYSYRIKAYNADFFDINQLKKLIYEIKPDVIINCAAMTDVDKCETDRKLCWNLNTTLVENLISISRVIDCHLVTISTDFVFDGRKGPYTEEATPNPINYYGKSKHAAENACLLGLERYTIIRTSTVFGVSSFEKPNFVSWVLEKLINEQEFKVVEGQYCTPTITDDIAQCVLKVLLKRKFGIYNACGKDFLNRYDFAKKIAKCFRYDEGLIHPMTPSELNQAARRPEKAGLVTLKATSELQCDFADIQSALFSYRLQLNDEKYFYQRINYYQ